MPRTLMIALTALTVLIAASISSFAGPPLICHEFKIDGAQSISWGSRAYDIPRGVSADALADETIAVLDSAPSVLVRMETIRRATLIAGRKTSRCNTLLTRVMARALDAEASGTNVADAWFDVGFLAQSMDQNYSKATKGMGMRDGIVGYAWTHRALELEPDNAQMHFAAALMTALHDDELRRAHMAKARAGSADDRLLAVNITRFSSEIGEHLDHHRRNYRSGH